MKINAIIRVIEHENLGVLLFN